LTQYSTWDTERTSLTGYKEQGREIAEHSMKGMVTRYQLKESYWELRTIGTRMLPENY
jgi:hypothetical protein